MTEEVITALVTEQRYVVKNAKEEGFCWEVKGTKDSEKVEAYFDAVSGELVKTK